MRTETRHGSGFSVAPHRSRFGCGHTTDTSSVSPEWLAYDLMRGQRSGSRRPRASLLGAFDRSIKAKGLGGPKGVKLLAGHDWAKQIGVITRLEAVACRAMLKGHRENTTHASLIQIGRGLQESLSRVLSVHQAARRAALKTPFTPSWLILKPLACAASAIARSAFPAARRATISRIAACSASCGTSWPSSPRR